MGRIFLYGDRDQSTEFVIGSKLVSFPPNTVSTGVSPILTPRTTSDPLVLYADTDTASTFWNPVIPSSGSLGNYWQFGSNSSSLVAGPYLVRNATISAHGQLVLRGDLNSSTTLTLLVPPEVTSVTWNGAGVPVKTIFGIPGFLQGHVGLTLAAEGIKVPKLTDWKFKDSLPEVTDGFDDSRWVEANKTSTYLPPMLYGDGRVLYGCDYGL